MLALLFPAEAQRLAALAVEAGRSRVNAGIHYQFDADVGLALRRTIGEFAAEYDRANGVLLACAEPSRPRDSFSTGRGITHVLHIPPRRLSV